MFWLQENIILMKKMSRKCSTDQRCIRKRNTTYKIGTLETGLLECNRGAFCQFPFRWIYYYGSYKSTVKKTSKTHLCWVPNLVTKLCQNWSKRFEFQLKAVMKSLKVFCNSNCSYYWALVYNKNTYLDFHNIVIEQSTSNVSS